MTRTYNFTITLKNGKKIEIKKATGFNCLPDGTFYVEQSGEFGKDAWIMPVQWFPSRELEHIGGEYVDKFDSQKERVEFFKTKTQKV